MERLVEQVLALECSAFVFPNDDTTHTGINAMMGHLGGRSSSLHLRRQFEF